MTTYTLAITDRMLLATVPDGDDIAAAVAAEIKIARVRDLVTYKVVTGCTLTDDPPEQEDMIIWHSGNGGWLMDETDQVWTYAVRGAV